MDQNIISALRKTAEGLAALAAALESGNVGVPDPPNLTASDVAELLNCSEDTIRSAVHRENDPMPVIHIGSLLRFRRSQVLEWAGRQRPRSKPVRDEKPSPGRVASIGIRRAVRRGGV